MKLKRICVAALAVGGMLAIMLPAHAEGLDSLGPPCTQIVDGQASYTTHPLRPQPLLAIPQTTPTVDGFMGLSTAACGDVASYWVHVMDTTETIQLSQAQISPKGWTDAFGHGVIDFSIPVDAPAADVCVYMETRSADATALYDRSPDSGCVHFGLDDSPNYSFH